MSNSLEVNLNLPLCMAAALLMKTLRSPVIYWTVEENAKNLRARKSVYSIPHELNQSKYVPALLSKIIKNSVEGLCP